MSMEESRLSLSCPSLSPSPFSSRESSKRWAWLLTGSGRPSARGVGIKRRSGKYRECYDGVWLRLQRVWYVLMSTAWGIHSVWCIRILYMYMYYTSREIRMVGCLLLPTVHAIML